MWICTSPKKQIRIQFLSAIYWMDLIDISMIESGEWEWASDILNKWPDQSGVPGK